jgi:hypothetical protein
MRVVHFVYLKIRFFFIRGRKEHFSFTLGSSDYSHISVAQRRKGLSSEQS